MAKKVTTALILAGHGSHITPQTAGLVWEHVDALRAMGIADEVTAAFWKEVPSFHSVLGTVTAEDITVVPLFTAQGYFTQTVIPAEMGMTGPLTNINGRTIRYTRTLSEHPYLSHIVRQRAEETIAREGLDPSLTAVAIIGHGTRRNPESRKATEAQADQIRALAMFAEVQAVYLDDAPEIAEIYELTDAPNIVAIPYFLALGSHATRDVPEHLGLLQGQTTGIVKDRTVYYTNPVGIEESLREAILELARDAGTALRRPSKGSAWDCFPAAGRDELISQVNSVGGLILGDLLLTPTEVRPRSGGATETITEPQNLRVRMREEFLFRPLATSNDLPGGWRVQVTDPAMIHAVVETVYPGAVADWAAQRSGTLEITPLKTLAARQSGMYKALKDLKARQRSLIVDRLCEHCVRHPTWIDQRTFPDEPGAIPCPEACNLWMTEALGELNKSAERPASENSAQPARNSRSGKRA